MSLFAHARELVKGALNFGLKMLPENP